MTPKIIAEDLRTAYGFLLRLPLPHRQPLSPLSCASLWACIPIGLLIGTLVAISGAIMQAFGLPLRFVAWGMIGVAACITGALHEDALADVLDGFFGGKDNESRLKIMKDSQIGIFGVLGLVIFKSAEAELLVQLLSTEQGLVIIAALAGISRGFWSLALHLSPALQSGKASLAHQLGTVTDKQVIISLGLIAILAYLTMSFLLTLILWSVLCGVCFLWVSYCRYKIGGINGDCLGSLQQISFLLGLLICVLAIT